MQPRMNPIERILGAMRRRLEKRRVELRKFLLRRAPGHELPRAEWSRSIGDPTGFYIDAFRYFGTLLPDELKEHRRYFDQEQRGYGEDAFHVMWFLLFREFRFETFLEIGVYRGQTLSLAAMLQRRLGIQGNVMGISPFTPLGDGVSRYRDDLDYLQDTLDNFAHFELPRPALVRALSTDPVAVSAFGSRTWDCIYIDGGHDYDVVRADWNHAADSIRPGGVIVLDDAALNTSFRPPFSRFKGHPGPSKVADAVHAPFVEILRVGHNRAFLRGSA